MKTGRRFFIAYLGNPISTKMSTSKNIIELSTSEGYDQWSEIYDSDMNPLCALDEIALRENFDIDLNCKKVLDMGCGTGRVTQLVEKKGAIVTGIDGSVGMLKVARQKCRPSTEFIRHDFVSALPLSSDEYDYLVSCLVLEHIEDLDLFFSEIKRVCKKNAKIYATAMHPGMMLKGTHANFIDPKTGQKKYPKGYAHQVSDFTNAIINAGLKIKKLSEYFGTEELAKKFPKANKYLYWPMLICFNIEK